MKRKHGNLKVCSWVCIAILVAFVAVLTLSAFGVFHDDSPPSETVVYDHPVFLNNEESGN